MPASGTVAAEVAFMFNECERRGRQPVHSLCLRLRAPLAACLAGCSLPMWAVFTRRPVRSRIKSASCAMPALHRACRVPRGLPPRVPSRRLAGDGTWLGEVRGRRKEEAAVHWARSRISMDQHGQHGVSCTPCIERCPRCTGAQGPGEAGRPAAAERSCGAGARGGRPRSRCAHQARLRCLQQQLLCRPILLALLPRLVARLVRTGEAQLVPVERLEQHSLTVLNMPLSK